MSGDYEYRKRASCIGISYQYESDENPFFQQGRGEVYRVARAFCSGCPVVVDCLIENLEEHIGFWGCMSVNERQGIRRDMRLGIEFVDAVEKVWSYHRRNGENKAPSPEVWKEWNV